MHFPYHILMRHFRLSINVSGSCLWLGTRLFADACWGGRHPKKLHLGLCHLAYMSLLICHLGYPTLGPVSVFLMEICLGDQQFVTLLLYLDNICVFAASIDKMLDHIELVFKQLEEFNLKIKPKKYHFLPVQCSLPQACTICRGYICKSQEGRKGKEIGWFQLTQKNYNHFWGWPLITTILYQDLLQ